MVVRLRRIVMHSDLLHTRQEICARMRKAHLVTLRCDDRELLQERPAELARLIRDFLE